MFVEIEVAWVNLALTAALISAFQSMLVDVLLPDVVTALDDVVLLVPVVALLTVMFAAPSLGRPGRPHAGPDDPPSAQQLEQVLRHLVRGGFRRHRGLCLHLGRGQLRLLGCDVDVLDRRIGRLKVLGLGRDRVRR